MLACEFLRLFCCIGRRQSLMLRNERQDLYRNSEEKEGRRGGNKEDATRPTRLVVAIEHLRAHSQSRALSFARSLSLPVVVHLSRLQEAAHKLFIKLFTK